VPPGVVAARVSGAGVRGGRRLMAVRVVCAQPGLADPQRMPATERRATELGTKRHSADATRPQDTEAPEAVDA
jgi:hypothetical protein